PRERGRARRAQCTWRTGTRQLTGGESSARSSAERISGQRRLTAACGARGGGAKRGEERVDLDLPHGAIADRRIEHAGEREVETAAVAQGALRPDLPVVRFDDSLADG